MDASVTSIEDHRPVHTPFFDLARRGTAHPASNRKDNSGSELVCTMQRRGPICPSCLLPVFENRPQALAAACAMAVWVTHMIHDYTSKVPAGWDVIIEARLAHNIDVTAAGWPSGRAHAVRSRDRVLSH